MKQLRDEFLRFCAVGAIGFVVDAGLLYLLMKSGVSAYAARAVSFAAAVTVTWAINRRFTFRRGRSRSGKAEFMGYAAVQGAGAGVNYAVFALVYTVLPSSPAHAMIALIAGSSIALLVNFTGLRKLVFRVAEAG